MIRTPDGNDSGPQSVRRAADLLFAFSLDRPKQSVAQLAEAVSLNRTTAHRILAALQQVGLVRKDLDSGMYSLGPRILRLSEVFLHQLHDLRAVATPHLVDLRDATGETAALHVRDDFARVVVEQVESKEEVRRTYPDLGEPLSLHRGAPSLAILAFLEAPDQDRYLREAGVQWPDFSERDEPDLRQRLREVRDAGFALSVEDRTAGVISVAAPIFDWTRRVVGAVNASGPVQRISRDEALRLAPIVTSTAAHISADLGYEPSPAGQLTAEIDAAAPSRLRKAPTPGSRHTRP